jgi:hypothetical protein
MPTIVAQREFLHQNPVQSLCQIKLRLGAHSLLTGVGEGMTFLKQAKQQVFTQT